MNINLQVWGLIFSFLGSLAWLIDTLLVLRKGKTAIFVKGMKSPLERQKDGTYKQVKITKEEIRLLLWLLLITLGFLLQLIGSFYS